MDYFANQLKSLFQATDVTRRELAEVLDVPVSTVSEWARGDATPDLCELRDIAEYFELPVSFFLDDTDSFLDMDKVAAELGLSPVTLDLLEMMADTEPDNIMDAVDNAVYTLLDSFRRVRRECAI